MIKMTTKLAGNNTYICNRTSIYQGRPCDEAFQATKGGVVLWWVKVDSIKDFVRKYGKIVVSSTEDGSMKLEIYDYYRE